jgi:hypothetical protein
LVVQLKPSLSAVEVAKLLASRRTAQPLREVPCGEVFDMRGQDAVLMHVPHITASVSVHTQ